jgi:hypothetical protein
MRKMLAGAGVLTVSLLTLSFWGINAQEPLAFNGFVTNTPMPGVITATPLPSNPVGNATPIPSTTNPNVSVPVQVFEPPQCAYVEGQSASQACIELMAQYPEPNVTPINLDSYTFDSYSFWRVGPDPVNTFDAPNGNVNGQIPQGFNFVNVINQTDGWIQASDGGWISTNDALYKAPSTFVGVTLPEGWNQPFGWILDTTGIWASLTPGGESTSESGLVPLHYERYNIFAEAVDAEGWTWYMVGPNQWVKQIYMSVIKPVERPEGVTGRWVAIDLYEQSLVAYEDDRPVFATLISTGLPATETNEGLFQVWARLARDTMSGFAGAPSAYDLESVPWVQYFDESISLHGTYWHDFFGYRRSRGCVNLTISDSRWVFDFLANGAPDTVGQYVYVHSTGEYRKP